MENPTPGIQLDETPPFNHTFGYLATAIIFMVFGFLIAGALGVSFFEDDAESVSMEVAVMNAIAATETALVPATPTNVPVNISYSPERDYFRGTDDAPITIVEFSDFGCPYCARHALTTIPELLEHYDGYVKYVFRNYTIFGDPSKFAAHAARCAGDQGAFWEYHDLLFARRANDSAYEFSPDNLITIAGELNLDETQFTTCLADNNVAQTIERDFSEAQEIIGWQGTPVFLINGQIFTGGAQPFEVFQLLIDEELLRLGLRPPASES